MLKRKRLKVPCITDMNGNYYLPIFEGFYLQFLILCVFKTVGMATVPPTFNPRPVNVTAYVGDTATLSCSISALGLNQVIWKKSGNSYPLTVGDFVFHDDPSYSVKHIPYKDEWNLVISNVKPLHAGQYECEVSTKDPMSRHINLTVTGRPSAVSVNDPSKNRPDVYVTGSQFVERGHPIVLTCNATGLFRPPEEIDWFQNGIKISSNALKGIEITKYILRETKTLFSKLHIKRSDVKDAGSYVCRSSENKLANINIVILNAGSNHEKRGTVKDSSGMSSIKQFNSPLSESGCSRSYEGLCFAIAVALFSRLF